MTKTDNPALRELASKHMEATAAWHDAMRADIEARQAVEVTTASLASAKNKLRKAAEDYARGCGTSTTAAAEAYAAQAQAA